jgi:hypothetical protein
MLRQLRGDRAEVQFGADGPFGLLARDSLRKASQWEVKAAGLEGVGGLIAEEDRPAVIPHAIRAVRREAALAALAAGRPLVEVASESQLGVQTLRVYAGRAGISLRDTPRRLHSRKPLTEQQLAIIEDYRLSGSLRVTGAKFSISAERVRQLVAKHEELSGVKVPRGWRNNRGLRVERVTWRCVDCGVERTTLPSAVRERCKSCNHVASRIFDDATIEGWINRIATGCTMKEIATSADREQNSQSIVWAIWLYCIRSGRTLEESRAAFGPYSTRWIERKWPWRLAR